MNLITTRERGPGKISITLDRQGDQPSSFVSYRPTAEHLDNSRLVRIRNFELNGESHRSFKRSWFA